MDSAVKPYKHYLKELFIIAFPVFLGCMGHTLIGAGDIFVIAKYGIKELSAASIANSIIFTIMIFGLGILAAVSILLSNLRGEKKRVKKYLLSVIFLSAVLALLFSSLSYLSHFIIPYIGLEESLVPYIQEYIKISSFSLAGVFIYEGIKQFLQAFEIVKFPNYLSLFSVILNLAVNWIFVFGFWFIPSMGLKGAAIATLIVRLFAGAAMLVYVRSLINLKAGLDFGIIKSIIKTGTPIGIALLFEFLAFNIVTVLAGKEKSIFAAVHSILVTIANASFMVPFAISSALSVKVSYWFGAKQPFEVKRYSYAAIGAVLVLMSLMSLLLAVFPKPIISVFSADGELIKTAAPLISIAAAYQIFDGLQCAAGGILKGFKMTKTVGLCVLGSYWLIGAPIAYVLVSKFGMSLRGYWIALALSLFTMGIVQVWIAKKYYKKFEKEALN